MRIGGSNITFTTPARFCTPREHWPPFVSKRDDEIGKVSKIRTFTHVRSVHYIFGYTLVSPDLSDCTFRDHDLSHRRLKHPFFGKPQKLSKVYLWTYFHFLAFVGAVVAIGHHK